MTLEAFLSVVALVLLAEVDIYIYRTINKREKDNEK